MRLILLTIVLGSFLSCKKIDEGVTLRQLIFKEEADSLIQASKNYNAYPIAKRTSLFLENFNNNSNGWPIINPNSIPNAFRYAIVQDGMYTIAGEYAGGDGFYFYGIPKNIDLSNDYEIEFKIAGPDLGTGNPLTNNHGLYFGASLSGGALTGHYCFIDQGIDTKTLKAGINNSSSTLSNAYNSQAFTSIGEYDIITIRKINESLLYFINSNYVGLGKQGKFDGNLLGFSTHKELRIDYIKIDYLY